MTLLKPLAAIALVLALTGCETITSVFEKDKDPPLPGTRVSALPGATTVEADPSLASVAVKLPAPYTNGEWTQAGGAPGHAMYHLTLGDLPGRAWDEDIGEGADYDAAILSEPVAVADAVFTLDARSIVTAYNASTGRVFWRYDLEPSDEEDGYFGGGLAFADGRLFVTTGWGKLIALEGRSGRLLWQQDLSGPVRAAPATDSGRVFAITLANRSYALDAASGRVLWTHEGIEEIATVLGGASPAVEGTTVLMPYSSGEIYALHVENGRVIWNDNLSPSRRTDPLSDLAQIRGEPVIDRGVAYVASHAGTLVAFDMKRGSRIWEVNFGGIQRPWAAGDWVFLVTNEAEVVCLSRSDGRVRWVAAMPRYGDPEDRQDPITWYGPILASDRLILAGSNGDAYALSPYTGERIGVIELPSGATVAPIVANNTLYFISDDADIVALR